MNQRQLSEDKFVSDALIYLKVVGTRMKIYGRDRRPYLALIDGRNYVLAQINDMSAKRAQCEGECLMFSVIPIYDWDTVQTKTSHTIILYIFSFKISFNHVLGYIREHTVMLRQQNTI
jgi:hypothetical protein